MLTPDMSSAQFFSPLPLSSGDCLRREKISNPCKQYFSANGGSYTYVHVPHGYIHVHSVRL